jgi:hypothetical protein
MYIDCAFFLQKESRLKKIQQKRGSVHEEIRKKRDWYITVSLKNDNVPIINAYFDETFLN